MSLKTPVKEKAKLELRRLMGEAERGAAPENEVRKLRYHDLRAALLQNYVERGNKSLQTTADGDETIWGLKALDEYFGWSEKNKGMPVAQITTDVARDFTKKRLAAGVKNGTANGSLALLRRMLTLAYDERKIQTKPKIYLLKAGQPRKGFLTWERFELLLSYIPENLKPLITFLYYCGVRLGEAKQIVWEQVNLDEALIRLEGEQTKNEEPRIVPLPDVLSEMMKKLPKEDPVFDVTNLRKSWYKACVAAGLGKLTKVEGKKDPRYTGLIIHDLRRSAVRNLMKSGVGERVSMRISGHKTRDVFDRYHIVDTEDVVTAMRRVQQQRSAANPENGESLVRVEPEKAERDC